VLPLVSTVIAVDEDGMLKHSLDRTQFRASQTPQAFKFDVLTSVRCAACSDRYVCSKSVA
jgi:2-C-methyl-D-erythritol 4-phosphate cytidylyltransferase